MSSASAPIYEKRDSSIWRVMYEMSLQDAQGQPVAGAELVCEIAGDGSWVPGMSSKEVKRLTDEAGKASVTWNRRAVFDRDVKATVTVAGPEGTTLTLTALSEEEAARAHGPRSYWTPRDIERA